MSKLNLRAKGKGNPLVLLHGFPMNSKVWDHFSDLLAEDFKVVTIDLPGFGNSPLLRTPFTISDVAQEIHECLSENKIVDCVIIGHSMGGYVVLNLIEKYAREFSGFGLFHSTAYADTEEKKQSRTKVIEFIDKNGVNSFTSNFISPLFVNPNNPDIDKVRDIAIQSTAQSVKGYTLAMRERPDLTSVLKTFKNPILFLSGEKDAGIPVETILEQSSLAFNPEVHVLKGVAHMGMFENPAETSQIIKSFAEKCF